jgi:hypothetical protein
VEASVNGEEPYSERRETLLASLERDRQEIRRAVEDLRRSARSTAWGLSLGRRLLSHPVTWLAGGLALGLWLGRRRRASLV